MSVATLCDGPLLRFEAEPRLWIDDEQVRRRFVDRIEWMQFIDLMMYLPTTSCKRSTGQALAASLEARVPLLDHRLVEFSWMVPQKLKFGHGVGKILLRKVLHAICQDRSSSAPNRDFRSRLPLG